MSPFLISERKLDEAGDVQGALSAVREALKFDPNDKHVLARSESLENKFGYVSSIRISNLNDNRRKGSGPVVVGGRGVSRAPARRRGVVREPFVS